MILTGTGGPPNTAFAVLTSTKVVLPLSNWVSLITNQYGPGGGFLFTNGLNLGSPQRYFEIRTP